VLVDEILRDFNVQVVSLGKRDEVGQKLVLVQLAVLVQVSLIELLLCLLVKSFFTRGNLLESVESELEVLDLHAFHKLNPAQIDFLLGICLDHRRSCRSNRSGSVALSLLGRFLRFFRS
jgi:hypothetical protein